MKYCYNVIQRNETPFCSKFQSCSNKHHHSYKWGRTDCDSPDAPNTDDEGALNIPTPGLGADEQMTYYADEFGFDMPEVSYSL